MAFIPNSMCVLCSAELNVSRIIVDYRGCKKWEIITSLIHCNIVLFHWCSQLMFLHSLLY